jgi:hypothetical protein
MEAGSNDRVFLVQQKEDGRILQIGLTESQHSLLTIFLAWISKEKVLVQMPEDYDLVLKSEVCNKCKNK